MSTTKSTAAVQPDAAPSHEQTMARIREGLKRLGDLPIFSTSINKVRRVSSDPNSDAMAVAKEVLKDANLSTKLLRLGNSAYYNRGVGKISVISRAVIMLGFETIRNVTLTLKLIESFQNSNPDVDMSKMLVRSYLAAGFVRDLAEKCGVKDIEESYVCALLHNLGEITVAYVLPDEYRRIRQMMEDGRSAAAAENAVLGTSIHLISQELASSWEFPATVVSTMAPPSDNAGAAKDKVSFNRSIASLSHRLLEDLYGDNTDSDQMSETLERLSKTTGLNDGTVENYLNESFRQSCTLATEYGLDKKLLKPPLGNAEGTLRNKWARQFSFFASMDEPAGALPEMAQDTPVTPPPARPRPPQTAAPSISPQAKPRLAPPEAAVSKPHRKHGDKPKVAAAETAPATPSAATGDETPPAAPSSSQGDHQLQLHIIHEITVLISQSARLSVVFAKVLDGLHRGAGFERALLCLVTPDRRSYVARLAVGNQREVLRNYFSFPINPADDLFSKVLMEGGELRFDAVSARRWGNLLPVDFVKSTGAQSFIIAALRFQDKPVGFFYADCAVSQRPLGDEEQRNMLQFVTQARLALRLCS